MFLLSERRPALRRSLRSRPLSCGCTAGIYDTHSGEEVAIIDARGPACQDDAHGLDVVISLIETAPTRTPAGSDRA